MIAAIALILCVPVPIIIMSVLAYRHFEHRDERAHKVEMQESFNRGIILETQRLEVEGRKIDSEIHFQRRRQIG
jgi:hypothetical protein